VDLRYGARLLLQNPGFAIVVIVSLALGIGANAAIFQLLNAVRLRSLPVAKPERLAAVRIVDSPHCCRGDFYSDHADLTGGLWNQLRQQQQGFSDIAAWFPRRQNLGRGGEARPVDTLMISGNFFEVLGVRPSLGRLISLPDDYRGCGAQGAVVSYGFWQREFGGDRGALGRKITLDGYPFQIMGVTPPNFYGVEVGRNFDVAIPLCAEAVFSTKGSLMDSPASWWITTIGRLKPGWKLERASAQLATISPGIFAATVPAEFDSQARKDYLSFRLGAVSVAIGFSKLRSDYQEPLWLLLALSGLVLLIACANLANLMLARGSARQREMALRLTLGASRSRLIRQLLTESFLLAGLGAAAGAGLAQILSRVMVTFLSTQQDRIFLELTPDWRVLGFVTGLAVLACILFGLTPAIKASHTEPGVVLKASGRGLSAAGESVLLRRVLVVSQVALSLVLLMGALLFVRTLQNLMVVNAGFQEDHILIANFDYSPLKLSQESQMAFKRDLIARVQTIPGVSSVAETLFPPLSHAGWDDNVDIPDGPQRQDVHSLDNKGAGKTIDRGTFIVRTSGSNPLALSSILRREVPRAWSEFRVSNIRTQAEINQALTVRERLLATLALFFAVVALLLAGVGLYGVLDYSVLQRRREIGIRMAVGAQAGKVARLVTVDVFSMVLVGALVGLALGIVSARSIETLLYQVKATDLVMLALPLLTILAAALLASLPAVIRAVRIDPVTMLRFE
jgi:predicted permease